MRDDLGEPVVVVAKALSMPREVLYRVLMFVNPTVGHSVERVHALAALNDEMTQAAAEGMVAIWQALQQRDRACISASADRLGRRNATARAGRLAPPCNALLRRNEQAGAGTFHDRPT